MNLVQFLMAVGTSGAPPETLARPSAPSFTLHEGSVAGQYLLNVTALPASWGDLASEGDGLGVPGSLQWWNAVNGWQTLAAGATTGLRTVSISASLWGHIEVLVQGVSAAGRTGVAARIIEEVVTADGVVVTVGATPVTIFTSG